MSRERDVRRSMVGLLLLLLLVSAACSGGGSPVASVSPAGSTERTGPPTAAPTSMPSGSPPASANNFLVSKFDVADPEGFAVGFGSVWVPGHRNETISRIDARTNEVVAVIKGIGYQAQDVVAADGSVWVPASGADYIARIDPATNRVVSRLNVGAVSDVDFGFGSLWAATKDMQLLRIDPESEHVVAKDQVGPGGGNDCNNTPVVTADWVWVGVCDTGMLMQVDPDTNRIVTKIDMSKQFDTSAGWGVVASSDKLWTVFNASGAIARLDAETGRVIHQATVGYYQVGFMWLDGGTLWMGGQGVLTALDAESLKTLATYQVATVGEVHPGVGFGSVWVTDFDLSEVMRFDFPAAS